ncbi:MULTISPECIES: hypothetical protein [unclassified Endozoicomonas]|uniref:hypothetical protein n=1 Tax=unclassified Endozoicomonas TaxID=2644528 RepID=UPI003BB4FB8E
MAHNRHSDDPMERMEISIRNTQDGIQRLFLHSAKHEQAIESLQQDVSSLQQDVGRLRHETRERFDKIEDTLAIIVNHLQK